MKICLISEYFHPDNTGGTGTVLSRLARYLQDHYGDVKIHVITSKNLYRGGDEKLPAHENWQGIEITRLQTPKSNRPSTALRLAAGLVFTMAVLRRLLRHSRYDMVFIVTNPPTLPIAVKVYSRLRRTSYVYLIHDLYPDVATALQVLSPDSFIARVFHRFQRGWLHKARKVVVLGRCMRDYLVQHYQVPSKQVEVVTNWSNASAIQPQSKETRFRVQNKLSGFVVLYAGNFGQYQNFDCILDAAQQLQSSLIPITFVFVGEGARKKHIVARVDAEKLSNVRVLPFVPHEAFADLLASADVSLVTLEPGAEGLGVPSKFYNILASGRTTVALVAPNSEVARVLQEAGCGITVEQSNAGQLAEVLQDLAQAPDRLQQMGENARRVFEEKYTLPRVAARFHAVFEEACRPQ
jgi:glycosyltransferase involved in cell wall biosynthesis